MSAIVHVERLTAACRVFGLASDPDAAVVKVEAESGAKFDFYLSLPDFETLLASLKNDLALLKLACSGELN